MEDLQHPQCATVLVAETTWDTASGGCYAVQNASFSEETKDTTRSTTSPQDDENDEEDSDEQGEADNEESSTQQQPQQRRPPPPGCAAAGREAQDVPLPETSGPQDRTNNDEDDDEYAVVQDIQENSDLVRKRMLPLSALSPAFNLDEQVAATIPFIIGEIDRINNFQTSSAKLKTKMKSKETESIPENPCPIQGHALLSPMDYCQASTLSFHSQFQSRIATRTVAFLRKKMEQVTKSNDKTNRDKLLKWIYGQGKSLLRQQTEKFDYALDSKIPFLVNEKRPLDNVAYPSKAIVELKAQKEGTDTSEKKQIVEKDIHESDSSSDESDSKEIGNKKEIDCRLPIAFSLTKPETWEESSNTLQSTEWYVKFSRFKLPEQTSPCSFFVKIMLDNLSIKALTKRAGSASTGVCCSSYVDRCVSSLRLKDIKDAEEYNGLVPLAVGFGDTQGVSEIYSVSDLTPEPLVHLCRPFGVDKHTIHYHKNTINYFEGQSGTTVTSSGDVSDDHISLSKAFSELKLKLEVLLEFPIPSKFSSNSFLDSVLWFNFRSRKPAKGNAILSSFVAPLAPQTHSADYEAYIQTVGLLRDATKLRTNDEDFRDSLSTLSAAAMKTRSPTAIWSLVHHLISTRNFDLPSSGLCNSVFSLSRQLWHRVHSVMWMRAIEDTYAAARNQKLSSEKVQGVDCNKAKLTPLSTQQSSSVKINGKSVEFSENGQVVTLDQSVRLGCLEWTFTLEDGPNLFSGVLAVPFDSVGVSELNNNMLWGVNWHGKNVIEGGVKRNWKFSGHFRGSTKVRCELDMEEGWLSFYFMGSKPNVSMKVDTHLHKEFIPVFVSTRNGAKMKLQDCSWKATENSCRHIVSALCNIPSKSSGTDPNTKKSLSEVLYPKGDEEGSPGPGMNWFVTDVAPGKDMAKIGIYRSAMCSEEDFEKKWRDMCSKELEETSKQSKNDSKPEFKTIHRAIGVIPKADDVELPCKIASYTLRPSERRSYEYQQPNKHSESDVSSSPLSVTVPGAAVGKVRFPLDRKYSMFRCSVSLSAGKLSDVVLSRVCTLSAQKYNQALVRQYSAYAKAWQTALELAEPVSSSDTIPHSRSTRNNSLSEPFKEDHVYDDLLCSSTYPTSRSIAEIWIDETCVWRSGILSSVFEVYEVELDVQGAQSLYLVARDLDKDLDTLEEVSPIIKSPSPFSLVSFYEANFVEASRWECARCGTWNTAASSGCALKVCRTRRPPLPTTQSETSRLRKMLDLGHRPNLSWFNVDIFERFPFLKSKIKGSSSSIDSLIASLLAPLVYLANALKSPVRIYEPFLLDSSAKSLIETCVDHLVASYDKAQTGVNGFLHLLNLCACFMLLHKFECSSKTLREVNAGLLSKIKDLVDNVRMKTVNHECLNDSAGKPTSLKLKHILCDLPSEAIRLMDSLFLIPHPVDLAGAGGKVSIDKLRMSIVIDKLTALISEYSMVSSNFDVVQVDIPFNLLLAPTEGFSDWDLKEFTLKGVVEKIKREAVVPATVLERSALSLVSKFGSSGIDASTHLTWPHGITLLLDVSKNKDSELLDWVEKQIRSSIAATEKIRRSEQIQCMPSEVEETIRKSLDDLKDTQSILSPPVVKIYSLQQIPTVSTILGRRSLYGQCITVVTYREMDDILSSEKLRLHMNVLKASSPS